MSQLTISQPSHIRSKEPGGAERGVEVVHLDLISSALCEFERSQSWWPLFPSGPRCCQGQSPFAGLPISRSFVVQPTSKEKRSPQHVERKLDIVELKCLVGLCAGESAAEVSDSGKRLRSRGSYSSVKGSNSKVRGVTHQTVQDSPDLE
jgi:hypothetical protein